MADPKENHLNEDDKEVPLLEAYQLLATEEETAAAATTRPVVPTAPYEEDRFYHYEYAQPRRPRSDEAPLVPVEPSAPLASEIPAAVATTGAEDDIMGDVVPQEEDESEEDAVAAQAALEARAQGVAVIRDHVTSYLELNPEASYVTWIATLHPENAEVTIDPRFLIPGNPWSTVYEEAIQTLQQGVVPYNNDNDERGRCGRRRSPNDDDDRPQQQQQPQRQSQTTPTTTGRYYGGLIPMVVGFSMVLNAIVVALTLQITSTVFYWLALLCDTSVQLVRRCCGGVSSGFCTAVLVVLPWSLQHLFLFLDSFLLILDTLVVELLAAIVYLICAPLSLSHAVGVFYHQQTRRLPHYVRWACRKPFHNNNNNSRAAGGGQDDRNNNDPYPTRRWGLGWCNNRNNGAPSRRRNPVPANGIAVQYRGLPREADRGYDDDSSCTGIP
jgi:hypothetical protein